jgi:hypothetical protein
MRAGNQQQRNPVDTRLRGRRLVVARVVWVGLVISVLGAFALGVPRTFEIALTLRPTTRAGLAQLGLSASFNALYLVSLDTVTMLGFTLFALLIFWRRSDDWMIMLVGIMLLLSGMLYTAPAFEARIPVVVIASLAALAEISQVAFLLLFPDGRFVPRWTWLLLVPLVVWRPAIWGLVYLPNFLALRRSGEDFYYIPQNTWDIALLLAILAVGVGTQVHRYYHHSTPAQRQQTKWLVLGVIVAVSVVGGYVVAINTLQGLRQIGADALLVRLASRTSNHLALLLIPVTLTLAILRYRLWDIDALINRTLVYGTLSATLGATYAGLVIGLQFLLRGLTEGNQLALAVSTLTIAVLFRPLRRRIQHDIDRRFYRRRYDVARTIAAFSATLRTKTDLAQLSEQLVAVVQETMQPAHVSFWLCSPSNSSSGGPSRPSEPVVVAWTARRASADSNEPA